MSNKTTYFEPNGDVMEVFWEAECPYCGKIIDCSWPSYETEDETVICPSCAFLHGHITEEELRRIDYTFADVDRIVIHDGKVYGCIGRGKLPWERTDKDIRRSGTYSKWRTDVFERDDYTCAICGKRGGELNAHHIKPFAQFPDDRFDVDNGITLCKACHIKVHKEADSEWLHTGKQDDIRK